MAGQELHGLFDQRIKQFIGEIKTVCYDRHRKEKDIAVGSRGYADCVDQNMARLQKF